MSTPNAAQTTTKKRNLQQQNTTEQQQKRRRGENEGKPPTKTLSRPPNSFMLFSQEQRSLIQKEDKNLSNAEISKILGQRWRELHPSKKQIYRDRAEQLRVEFDKQRSQAAHGTVNSEKTKEV